MTDGPPDDDVVDTGARRPRRPPTRRRRATRAGAVLVLVGAVVSLVLVHGDGGRHAPGPRSTTSAPPPATDAPARLQLDGTSACGTLVSGVLSVAFAVLNTGGQSMILRGVRPVLPLAGLRPLGDTVDRRPPAGAGCPDSTLHEGDTLPAVSGGWISLSFAPTTACLSPLPIEADVVFVSGGRTETTRLLPFPDLGAVEAAGRSCPGVAAT